MQIHPNMWTVLQPRSAFPFIYPARSANRKYWSTTRPAINDISRARNGKKAIVPSSQLMLSLTGYPHVPTRKVFLRSKAEIKLRGSSIRSLHIHLFILHINEQPQIQSRKAVIFVDGSPGLHLGVGGFG